MDRRMRNHSPHHCCARVRIPTIASAPSVFTATATLEPKHRTNKSRTPFTHRFRKIGSLSTPSCYAQSTRFDTAPPGTTTGSPDSGATPAGRSARVIEGSWQHIRMHKCDVAQGITLRCGLEVPTTYAADEKLIQLPETCAPNPEFARKRPRLVSRVRNLSTAGEIRPHLSRIDRLRGQSVLTHVESDEFDHEDPHSLWEKQRQFDLFEVSPVSRTLWTSSTTRAVRLYSCEWPQTRVPWSVIDKLCRRWIHDSTAYSLVPSVNCKEFANRTHKANSNHATPAPPEPSRTTAAPPFEHSMARRDQLAC